jgi:hypothetical protein
VYGQYEFVTIFTFAKDEEGEWNMNFAALKPDAEEFASCKITFETKHQ